MVGNGAEKCPACGTPATGNAWCPVCGLELAGEEAQHLRALAADLAAAEAELQVVWTRRDAVAKDLAARQWARAMHAQQPPASAPAASPGWQQTARGAHPAEEWTVDRVRNLLLWAGATLLALSALAFTAVAWTHLGPGGRAALLIVITIIAALGATAARDRLPATSGALTGLAIALALIDWQIVRRAGVAPGLSGAAWWAIGTGAVGLAALGLARVAARRTAYRAVVVLAPTSAVLAVAAGASSAWSAALGLSLLSAALVAGDLRAHDRLADPVIRPLLRLEAGASWIVGSLVALVAASVSGTFVQTLTPAAVFVTFALAPALVLRLPAARPKDRVAMASLVLATIPAAALTIASAGIGAIGLLTLAAALGSAAVAGAPWYPGVWRGAAQRTGWVVIVPGMVFAGSLALIAEFGPLAWLAHAWTGSAGTAAASVVAGPTTSGAHHLGWCAVGTLLAVAVALAIALRPRADATPPTSPFVWPAIPAGVFLGAIVLAPFAAGASVGVTCALMTAVFAALLIASAGLARDDLEKAMAYAALAAVPAIPAAGWAATTARASIAVLAVVAGAAVVALLLARVPALRAGNAALAALAVTVLAAVVALANGASTEPAGFAAAVTAGAMLVLGAQVRRDKVDGIALEITGAFGIVGGALLAAPSAAWLAATLTAAVPLLLAAGLRGHRSVPYGVVAALAALGATWAWLVAADVSVVEAYTLPAAVVALGLGSRARRDGPAHSWLTLGPAVFLALGPTLVLAIARNDDGRAIAVGLAALAILLAGAYRRLQAPIVLGALVLIVLGVDKLGPTAVRLPRWLMLAFAGSVLLWVGTTFERRRDDALRAARRFEQLG